ncbi:hypothetical protein NQ176_g1063 [Zarea fungicola]|uniref:Uncharacterized protein n=1 Tax=Zarea fungicola TaxID=93591 RepID=A0ACC1NVV3_9HYPO|nr:hypothetical protein NQ176_g1063 [Lecanicillium fungicola]
MSRYVYGRAFLGVAKSAVFQQLFKDPVHLREAALALAEVLMLGSGQNAIVTAANTTTHMARASHALETLRTLQPKTLFGVQTALTLALLLLWYNDINLGHQSLPISRSALLAAHGWQSDLIGAAAIESDANITSLLFAEIYECLIRREVPVFRYTPPVHHHRIDRHYGVCDGLLPYLYDVCELANRQKLGLLSRQESIEQAHQLVASIKAWMPVQEASRRMVHMLPMEEFEKQHLISQANIFRLMALLLIQSLQPDNDSAVRHQTALKLRQSILDEMQQGPRGPRYLLFPYFISCLELAPSLTSDSSRLQVAEHMEEITNGLAPTSCRSMVEFMDTVWQSCEKKYPWSWFEIVDETPEFCIGP